MEDLHEGEAPGKGLLVKTCTYLIRALLEICCFSLPQVSPLQGWTSDQVHLQLQTVLAAVAGILTGGHVQQEWSAGQLPLLGLLILGHKIINGI